MAKFIGKEPTLEDYWRGIILLGRNVANFKFALAKSLLEIRPESGQLLKMEDLAPVFTKHVAIHLKDSPKQGTFGDSKYFKACQQFNKGELEKDRLTEIALKEAFGNVIDRFHTIGRTPTDKKFYIDERKDHKGLRITDEFSALMNGFQSINLNDEVEARWRLVERAWELNISVNQVAVQYDPELERLYTIDEKRRRKDVTRSRDALNGYQKGKCFYCFSDISLKADENLSDEMNTDVDHFFPDHLKKHGYLENLDGVWNLVLSCKDCNRGQNGKFGSLPSLRLLESLYERNEALIKSCNPLRETLIEQTGKNEETRAKFLNKMWNRSRSILLDDIWDIKS